MPFALDCSPRGARALPLKNLTRDPDLVGYASNGPAGYGREMLFGQPELQQQWIGADQGINTMDLKIAKWRLSHGAQDPNPFTLNGSVPVPSPRRDPRRHVQHDLRMAVGENDAMGWEMVRREMVRPNVAQKTASAEALMDQPAEATGLRYSPHRTSVQPASEDPNRGMWRMGDKQPLSLDGRCLPPHEFKPIVDTTWRTPDKDGVALAFGGLAQA